jgi:hypothetical protein
MLDVIRKLATALSVSADLLLFGKDEGVSRCDAEEKRVIRSLLEGMILKHEARRWSSGVHNGKGK